MRIVARPTPETIARDALARAPREFFDVAGDPHARIARTNEDRHAIGEAVARMKGCPIDARTHDTDFTEQMPLRADTVAAVRRKPGWIDDLPGAGHMRFSGSMAALAGD